MLEKEIQSKILQETDFKFVLEFSHSKPSIECSIILACVDLLEGSGVV